MSAPGSWNDVGTAYNPALWSSFFSAQASASAALTGLLFVAVSINLQKVVTLQEVTARAAKALATLAAALIISTLCLVPGQSAKAVGWEIVPVGTAAWAAITMLQRWASKDNPCISPRQRFFQTVLAEASCLPYVAGGISLLWMRGGGLYWLVGGILMAIIAGLLDAWVLLIEILR